MRSINANSSSSSAWLITCPHPLSAKRMSTLKNVQLFLGILQPRALFNQTMIFSCCFSEKQDQKYVL